MQSNTTGAASKPQRKTKASVAAPPAPELSVVVNVAHAGLYAELQPDGTMVQFPYNAPILVPPAVAARLALVSSNDFATSPRDPRWRASFRTWATQSEYEAEARAAGDEVDRERLAAAEARAKALIAEAMKPRPHPVAPVQYSMPLAVAPKKAG